MYVLLAWVNWHVRVVWQIDGVRNPPYVPPSVFDGRWKTVLHIAVFPFSNQLFNLWS